LEALGIKTPAVPGNPNGVGMMNPPISSVYGYVLPGTNNRVNTQESLATLKKTQEQIGALDSLATLKKNQEQIAALEATIRKLQQELETAKKGAGK